MAFNQEDFLKDLILVIIVFLAIIGLAFILNGCELCEIPECYQPP